MVVRDEFHLERQPPGDDEEADWTEDYHVHLGAEMYIISAHQICVQITNNKHITDASYARVAWSTWEPCSLRKLQEATL